MIYIVHGPPAAGKSTIANVLRDRLRIPHMSADNLNEWVSDITGDTSFESQSSWVGHELMFKLLGELSIGEGSFIIEGCLNCDSVGERIQEVLLDSKHKLCEIFVTAGPDVLLERYRTRAASGERHRVHGREVQKYETLKQHLAVQKYCVIGVADQALTIKNEGKSVEDLEQELRQRLGIN